jgi:hypothetical protein
MPQKNANNAKEVFVFFVFFRGYVLGASRKAQGQ